MSGPRTAHPPADWTLEPVTRAEWPLLHQLLQFYSYDFSELEQIDVGIDGRFATDWFRLYDTDPTRHALLLRVRGQAAGFVLVREQNSTDNPDAHMIAEFFVMRAYRHRGYGEAMARAVFARFPGRWQVAEISANQAAQRFWRRVIDDYTGGCYQEEIIDSDIIVQRFDTSSEGAR